MKRELAKQNTSITGGMSAEQVQLIKNTIAKDATDDELKLFLYTANRTGLDPLTRQIHFVKRMVSKNVGGQWVKEGQMTIQTGIDGYRAIATRTGELAGEDDVIFDSEDKDHPNKATVTVYRLVKGNRVGFTASARWEEYVQQYNDYKTGENKLGPMWKKMPYLMLAKCAASLAYRKAFPNDLSGVYTNEEMEQADQPIKNDYSVKEVQDIQESPEELPTVRIDDDMPEDFLKKEEKPIPTSIFTGPITGNAKTKKDEAYLLVQHLVKKETGFAPETPEDFKTACFHWTGFEWNQDNVENIIKFVTDKMNPPKTKKGK